MKKVGYPFMVGGLLMAHLAVALPNTETKKNAIVKELTIAFSISDPDGILTHDLQNRNLTLYTAELRSLFCDCKGSKLFEL